VVPVVLLVVVEETVVDEVTEVDVVDVVDESASTSRWAPRYVVTVEVGSMVEVPVEEEASVEGPAEVADALDALPPERFPSP